MRARFTLWVALIALILGGVMGCSRRQTVDLIPLEVLFGNPTQTQARIAPDGSALTWIAPLDGVLNIWYQAADEDEAVPLTNDTDRGIRYHAWLYDNEHVLYIQDRAGDENWRVYAVNVKTGDERELTPDEEGVDHAVRAELLMIDDEQPTKVVIGLNKRDARIHDAYLLDTDSGEMTLLEEGHLQSHGWLVDHDLVVRGWLRSNPQGGMTLMLRDGSEGDFDERITWDSVDELASAPLEFAGDNRSLYIKDSRGRNSAALYAYDTMSGEQTMLASDPMYDVGALVMDPVTHVAQAVYFVRDRKEYTVLDPSLEPDFEAIRENARGDVLITARTLDDQDWIVYYGVDNGPGVYYRYRRDEGRFEKLFETQPELTEQPLVKMEPIEFTARDGMPMHGYLSLPKYVDEPMPLVLLVHGGPWARDYWGYNPQAQWLANRGYACLQVNFRGSTGYGKQHLNAGDLEWGGKMQDDLTDGVRWAIDEGIADSNHVAIMGGSYGGYAALAGAAFTPDLYTCAVSIVGPSSLITLLSSIPPYWASFQKVFDMRTGRLPRYETGEKAGLPKAEKDWTDEDREAIEFLRSRSPLFYAEEIDIPLLIGQGANDVRVKQAESDQIVEALKKRGIEVEYVVYPDEGHGFAKPENRIDFFKKADLFLAKYLGGRAER